MGVKKHTTAKKATGMIAVPRDVTELKRAEEERVRAAADRARVEEMEKRIQKMRLIYEGSRKMALSLEPDEIYNRALELACTAMEADGGSLMTFDEKTDELVVKVASGSQKEIALGKRLKLGERFAGHAAQMKRALFMHDVEDEPWFKSLKKFEEIKSGMSIPLLVGDKVVGVINLKRTQRDEKFIKSDVGLVSILADYVASIIERNRAEEKLKKEKDFSETLIKKNPFGFMLVNSKKEIVDINSAALQIIGRERDEVIGKICHKFICPAEENRCPVFDLGQKVDHSEKIALGSNGQNIPILKSVIPIELEGEKCLMETFSDIIELKRAREELEAKIKQLEEFHELVVGRELKMKQMEAELVRLRAKLGEK